MARLKSVALTLLAEAGAGTPPIPEDMISEMCRFGAGEIHNIAAVVGGIAAQEAIKVSLQPKRVREGGNEMGENVDLRYFGCHCSLNASIRLWVMSGAKEFRVSLKMGLRLYAF